jgi:hypothetical protein
MNRNESVLSAGATPRANAPILGTPDFVDELPGRQSALGLPPPTPCLPQSRELYGGKQA